MEFKVEIKCAICRAVLTYDKVRKRWVSSSDVIRSVREKSQYICYGLGGGLRDHEPLGDSRRLDWIYGRQR